MASPDQQLCSVRCCIVPMNCIESLDGPAVAVTGAFSQSVPILEPLGRVESLKDYLQSTG